MQGASRREALALGVAGLVGVAASPKALGKANAEEVSPGEDLMREHGVLERLLLVYEEGMRRVAGGADVPWGPLGDGAALIREFVEDYHERLEEQHVFPRVRAAGRLEELVATLLAQHEAGRALTDEIRAAVAAGDGPRFTRAASAFVRMYRPHAAREDTVLFPSFGELLTRRERRELGERFEAEERDRFGEHGFESVVAKVAAIEAQLGIGDLAAFTP